MKDQTLLPLSQIPRVVKQKDHDISISDSLPKIVNMRVLSEHKQSRQLNTLQKGHFWVDEILVPHVGYLTIWDGMLLSIKACNIECWKLFCNGIDGEGQNDWVVIAMPYIVVW
jgi:hypothetical protein